MSKQYETVFIMTPVLSDDQAKETVSKFKKLLKDTGCKIIHEEDWGLRKLAYTIQKKTTGFYYLITFEGDGSAVADLELAYKRDERILRFMTIVLDKHGVAYNEKRRSKAGNKKKEEAAA
jgi:small subunit ribosomal protein S6